MNDLTLRLAKENELDTILKLYKSVIGEKFCVWDEKYPTSNELKRDYETKNLYVLVSKNKIAGALSIEPENEMDDFSCWKINDGTQKELARIVISKEERGKGYAYIMVGMAIDVLKERGCKSVHLSVAKCNTPALKTYQKLGFEIVGDDYLFNCSEYYLAEKII